MSLQQDSVVSSSEGAQIDSVAPKHAKLTPAQVLSWLPRDATPAQQDSAIQAHFKPDTIRWSQRPDTLHLPGHDKGKSALDVQLPQYYREGFFAKDSLLHPEVPLRFCGMPGDPVPYNAFRDNTVTILLLVSFVISVISFAYLRNFVFHQTKLFFYARQENASGYSETSGEVYFQAFLMLLSCLMMALILYFYTINKYGDAFMLKSQYYLILIFFASTISYTLLKFFVYWVVNSVFFDSKTNKQFIKALFFIVSLGGALLFPLVVIWTYYELSAQSAVIYFIISLGIVKILTFYKGYNIFFKRNVARLQIILYFCTLEIVPMLTFWGALEITLSSLKINF